MQLNVVDSRSTSSLHMLVFRWVSAMLLPVDRCLAFNCVQLTRGTSVGIFLAQKLFAVSDVYLNVARTMNNRYSRGLEE